MNLPMKNKIFSYYFEKKFGWIRIFGLGVKYKHIPTHPLLFSERNGYIKMLKINNWCVSKLRN